MYTRASSKDVLCTKCQFPIPAPQTSQKTFTSPVPHILHSNKTPTQLESRWIRDALNQMDLQISSIDAEIARARTTLEDLQRRREMLAEQRTAHSQLLSPIRRLYPELLSEVFIRCLPEGESILFPGCVPLLLGQVCAHWREVALSTPALWSSLFLTVDRPGGMADLAASTWLSRSGSLPISLTFFSSDEGAVSKVLEAIAPFFHRCKSLSFVLPASMVPLLVPKLRCTPLLQTLELSRDGFEGLEMDTTIMTPTTTAMPIDVIAAPTLTAFVTDMPLHDLNVLPWHQLTDLSIAGQSARRCLFLVARMPCLLSGTFLEVCAEHGTNALEASALSSLLTPIVSPLRRLRLRDLCSEAMVVFFSNLRLPELSELSLGNTVGMWPRHEFTDLASRSHFRLKRLMLRTKTETEYHEFSATLEGLKDLEELEMCFTDFERGLCIDYRFLRRLTYRRSHVAGSVTTGEDATREEREVDVPPPPPPMLPKLQVLKLRGLLMTSDRSLVRMIESRWKLEPPARNAISRLRFVGLKYHRPWDAAEIRRLEEFRKQGLEVVVEKVPRGMRGFVPQSW